MGEPLRLPLGTGERTTGEPRVLAVPNLAAPHQFGEKKTRKKQVFLDFALLLLRWGVLRAVVTESARPLPNAVVAPGGKLGPPLSLSSAEPVPEKSQIQSSAVGKQFIGDHCKNQRQ